MKSAPIAIIESGKTCAYSQPTGAGFDASLQLLTLVVSAWL